MQLQSTHIHTKIALALWSTMLALIPGCVDVPPVLTQGLEMTDAWLQAIPACIVSSCDLPDIACTPLAPAYTFLAHV